MSRSQAVSTAQAGSSPFYAGKNKIINGDFRINQRAFSSTTTDGTYGLDRFFLQSNGGCTYSVQTFTAGAAPVSGYEAINFARMLTTGQSGTSVYSILRHKIEDVRTIAGRTVTVSFWAKAASGTPKIAIETTQNFGSGGSPSGDVETYGGQVTLSTSWARYSVTFAVPSISGKTIGTTANTSFTTLSLWVSAGTDFNSRTGSIGVQNNTFDIWGVQVEAGSTATAFQTATGTIQGELAACQRYYVDLGNCTFHAYSVTGVIGPRFPVTMRTTPTITLAYGGVTDRMYNLDAGTTKDLVSNYVIATTQQVSNWYTSNPASWATAKGEGWATTVKASAEL